MIHDHKNCLIWLKKTNVFKIKKIKYNIKHLMYSLYRGYIKNGEHVENICGNLNCIQPFHLIARQSLLCKNLRDITFSLGDEDNNLEEQTNSPISVDSSSSMEDPFMENHLIIIPESVGIFGHNPISQTDYHPAYYRLESNYTLNGSGTE